METRSHGIRPGGVFQSGAELPWSRMGVRIPPDNNDEEIRTMSGGMVSRGRSRHGIAVVACLLLLAGMSQASTIVFEDGFETPGLDGSKWTDTGDGAFEL